MSTILHHPFTRFSISPEMALLPYRNTPIPQLDRREKQDRAKSNFSAPPVVSSFGLLSLLGLAACSGSDSVSLPAGALEVTGASLSETPTINSVTDGDGNDTLNGGGGNDTLSGGDGDDRFALNPDGGMDIITDLA